MNKYRSSILLLIGIIFFVGVGNATVTTTYSCCNALETSSGTSLNNMSNLSQWIVYNGIGNVSLDTVNYTEGTSSLRMSSNATESVDWTLETPILFSELNKVSVWIYTENSSNTSGIDFYFANTTNFSRYMFVEIPQTALRVNQYSNPSYPQGNSGWKKYSFSTLNGTAGVLSEGHSVYKNMSQTELIKLIRIRNIPKSGQMSNISIDNIRYNYSGKAKAIIVFDDEYYNSSTFNIVKNTLITNNQKATMYVRIDHVGVIPSDLNFNNQSGYMNLSLLKELKSVGWDISSHTLNHTHLETDNASVLDTELKDSQQWFIDNGFSVKTSKLLAYPFGTYNQNVITTTKTYYLMARSTDNGIFQPLLSSSDYAIDNQSLIQGWQQVSSQLDDNITYNRINDTIMRGGIIVLGYHAVSPNGTATQSIEVNLSTFINISNYLASRSSDIDVVSMSSLLITSTSETSPQWGTQQNTDLANSGTGIAFVVIIVLLLLVAMASIKEAEYGDAMGTFVMVIFVIMILVFVLATIPLF